jgi:Cytochrome oxidase complex assembly protein 1
MDQPPGRSWWGRNWKWVLPCGCLAPFVLIGGCVAAGALLIFGSLKNSDAYHKSLEAVRANKEVEDALGAPLEPSFIVTGNIYVGTSGGHAQISYDVTGPKGSATVYAVAEKKDGEWIFRSIKVYPKESGKRIDVRVEDNVDQEVFSPSRFVRCFVGCG